MTVDIDSFDDLIKAVEQNNFKKDEVERIVWHTLKVIPFYNSKTELIESLKEYWSEWKDKETKPIFIGLEKFDYNEALKNPLFKTEIDKIEAFY